MSLYSSDRPEFAERVARLAGQTTYRVPTEGRGTRTEQLPDAHAIATALAEFYFVIAAVPFQVSHNVNHKPWLWSCLNNIKTR